MFSRHRNAILGTTLAVAAPIAALGLYYSDRAVGHTSRPDLVEPPADPIIGHLRLLTLHEEDLLHKVLELHERYGPTFSLTAPGLPRFIAIADPASVEHVLKTNFEAYVKGEPVQQRLGELLGHGIFATDGEHWKYQRKTAANIFNVRNFRDFMLVVFMDTINTLKANLTRAIDTHQGAIDMQDQFFRFTFDSFGRIGFGLDFGALTSPTKIEFAAAFDAAQGVLVRRFTFPWWKARESIGGLFGGNEMQRHVKMIDEIVYKIIDDRKNDADKEDKADLLSLFMITENENGEYPNEREMRDVVLNFIIAGRDTTAQALSWTFLMLALHPEVEQKLYNEVKDIDPSMDNKELFAKVRGLKYAHAVWNEVLRLYPSVPNNQKTCIKDDILPDGTRVQAGDNILWVTWAMGRLERIWGPTAKRFDPERWLQADFEKPTAFKWPAFHAGPRTCLGQQMATLEGVTCMALLIKEFTFELMGIKSERMYARSLTLPMRDPLMMRVSKRTSK